MSLHFLIVEDETLLRQLLIADIRKKFAGCRVTEAGSLDDLNALDNKGLEDLSLAIVDLELPDGNALDWVEAYATRETRPLVMVLSSISNDVVLTRALRSQASGFIHKNDGRESLIDGIEAVLSGDHFFSPTVQRLKQAMSADPALFTKILSEKEQQVLRLIAEGNSNQQIAEIEGSKVNTIVFHRRNIKNKLNIHSAPELMRYALEKGFATI